MPPLTSLIFAVTLTPLLQLYRIISREMESVKGGHWNDTDAEKTADPGHCRCNRLCPRAAGSAGRTEPTGGRHDVWRELPVNKTVKKKRVKVVPNVNNLTSKS